MNGQQRRARKKLKQIEKRMRAAAPEPAALEVLDRDAAEQIRVAEEAYERAMRNRVLIAMLRSDSTTDATLREFTGGLQRAQEALAQQAAEQRAAEHALQLREATDRAKAAGTATKGLNVELAKR